MDLKQVLFDLSAKTASSGMEYRTVDAVKALFEPYCDEIVTDALHNVLAIRHSDDKNAPTLLLDAHMDEIAMVVTGVREDGFLTFDSLAGIDRRTILATEVTVHAQDGDYYGIVSAIPPHLSTEEKSRAKERIFSFRNENHAWDPKNQRPEMWKLYNSKIHKGESIRVFPISNWTEADIWQYIKREKIEIVPLYFADVRPVVYRDGNIIMVDDDRMKLRPDEKVEMKSVRFRTLGCYPLTGGVESTAKTLDEIIDETLSAVSSERTTRVIDNEAAGSMERRKREGYF